jgi:predicted  nucleic acid-binding Zn-ribbon protein
MSTLDTLDRGLTSSTKKVQSLERELQHYKAELSTSKEALVEREIESTKLEAECAHLRSALVEAQASAGTKDDSELQERIAG